MAPATITIMDAIRAGAGGTATALLSMLTLVSRRLGAGLHTKVAMEAGLPVAGGRTANGLTTTRLPSVARETARPVAVAADLGIQRLGGYWVIERILNGVISLSEGGEASSLPASCRSDWRHPWQCHVFLSLC